MSEPFLIYALPRSRTAWLSQFLSYKEWSCHHEQAIFMRSMDDVRSFFSQPNIGAAETAVAQGRPLIKHAFPNIREVVILRPVDEVVESMIKVDIAGVGTYDRGLLEKSMQYGDRVLRKIAKDPNVLVVDYRDLLKKDTCANIFEHCLPYSFDKTWWESLKDKNIQTDVKAVLRYYYKHKKEIESFKNHCKSELRNLCRMGEIPLKRTA